MTPDLAAGLKRPLRRLGRLGRAARLRVRRRRLGRSGPVVTAFVFHRITESTPPSWGPWRYAISREAFEARVRRLAEAYDVVDLDRLLGSVRGTATLPDRAAVLTVDDGYRDFLTRAVPVLERYGVPATLYVSTGLLGSRVGPVSFRIATALRARDPGSVDLSGVDLDVPDRLPADRRRAFEAVYRTAKGATPAAREELLSALSDGEEGGSTPMLSREDVRSLGGHDLVAIGAHGHEHRPLPSMSPGGIREDVRTSAEVLREVLGEPVRHFSYPYGARDDVVAEVVAEAGFETAATTETDVTPVADLGARRYAIPRVDGARFRP